MWLPQGNSRWLIMQRCSACRKLTFARAFHFTFKVGDPVSAYEHHRLSLSTLLSSWAFKTFFWYGFVTHVHTFSKTSSRWSCTFQSNMMQWVWEDSLKGAQGTAAWSYRNRPQTFVQVQVCSQSQGTQKHEICEIATEETSMSLLDYHLLEPLYCKGKSSTQTPNQI